MKRSKKPNKYVVYVLTVIISIAILGFGFVTGKAIAERTSMMLVVVITAILFISGVLIKKKIIWIPSSIGAGMALFILSAILNGSKLW